jgi:hypothetical protein
MKTRILMSTFALFVTTWAMAQGVNVSGAWKAKTVSPRGTAEQTLTLTQTGSTFTGEMVNSQGVKEAVKDGKITGDAVEFSVERKQASGETALVPYKGTIKGNEMSGTFTGATGATVNWTATKESAGGSGM